MKRLIAVIPAIILATVLTIGAEAAYEPDVDYARVMINSAVSGDYETGRAAEASRNEKIDDIGAPNAKVSFDELMLLSKIMYAEAGSNWLSDEWKMCVGEVVLNRVSSPEFPNTIAEVLAQPGQYYGSNSRYFNNLKPSERCAELAFRLLNGERVMNDPAVVFQANFRQGSGTHTAVYDRYLGWTYFCFSSRPELYGQVVEAAAETEEPVVEEIYPTEEPSDVNEPAEAAPVEGAETDTEEPAADDVAVDYYDQGLQTIA